ncbi:hypothetical protein CUJ83_06385 [Methanocella sp. CWC-04]|uniref:Uncharacterized protein n=2 Tax=Methanooceanicella nereidis TaxID=2052831 RepID=A0AAP2W707_9EURY|nr:hypothetical protein [Methanocella sp. CWC-04]
MLLAALNEESQRAIKGTNPRDVLKDVKKMKKEYGRKRYIPSPQEMYRGEITPEGEFSQPPPGKRFITPDERRQLELKLHRLLVWVGVMTPEEFEIDHKKIPLHDIVWDLLEKECLTEEEKEQVRKLIWKLKAHVKADEEILHNNKLTVEEAREIFREAAGLMRAILDLKSVLGEKDYCTIKHTANRRRIEDAQSWLGFLKQIL